MIKENKAKIILYTATIVSVIALIYLFFTYSATILIFIIFFIFTISLLFEGYIRIQHNIDRVVHAFEAPHLSEDFSDRQKDAVYELKSSFQKELSRNKELENEIRTLKSGIVMNFFKNSQRFFSKIFIKNIFDRNKMIKETDIFYPKIWKKSILLITNRKLSGGSVIFEKNWMSRNEIKNNIIIFDHESENKFRVFFKNRTLEQLTLNNFEDFTRLLKKHNISEIFINQLVGTADLNLIDYIIESNIPYTYFIHDFYCIMSSQHLVDERGDYYSFEKIKEIFARNKDNWGSKFHKLLKGAKKVYANSDFSKSFVNKIYPDIDIKIYNSFTSSKFWNIYDGYKAKSVILEIGIAGFIGNHKGAKVILELERLIKEKNLPVKLKAFGTIEGKGTGKVSENLEIFGHYDKKDFQNIVKQTNVSFFIFPSLIPETYSYVCQEIIEIGYPILCFDLGAQVERISNGKYGWRIDPENGAFGLFDKIKELEQNRSLILEKSSTIKRDFPDEIDIIMPVYNAFFIAEKAIKSVIKNSDVKCNFIIIDDCSTDKKIPDFLRNLRSTNSLVSLKILRNKKNLGFVKTINKGVLNSKNHCIIINSDVIVPEKWLSRMIMPVKNDSSIATVTPWTNGGAMCSFPARDVYNSLPTSQLDKVDEIFRKVISPSYIEIPRGEGFCLLINRSALNEIGLFDQDNFEGGYCEEADWCLTARNLGWKNVLIQNLFVYHFLNASFKGRAQSFFIKNHKFLLEKHPNFMEIEQNFPFDELTRANKQKVVEEIKAFENQIAQSGQKTPQVRSFLDNIKQENKNIDILFVNNDEARGGAPKLLIELIKFLKSYYSVAVLSMRQGTMHEEFAKNFKNIIYPEHNFTGLSNSEIAKKIISAINPKMVYANTLFAYEYVKEAKKMGIFSVFHVHGFGEALKMFPERMKEEFNTFADIFIAVSNQNKEFMLKNLSCPKEKVFLINAFVDSKTILEKSREKNEEELAKEIGRKNGEFLVVAMGHLHTGKGTDLFIEAFRILDKKYPRKFRFLWLGGDYFLNFKLEVPNKENIIFLGEKENPFPYLSQADIFVLPSRDDAFPLVVMEAQALGKPIVAFKNSGGVSEMVRESGLLVENIDANSLAAALEKISFDDKLREKMSNAGPIEQKRYDQKVMLPKIKELVDDVFKTWIKKDKAKL